MTAFWLIVALMTGTAAFALIWPLSRRRRTAEIIATDGITTQTRFYRDQLAEIERDTARGLIGVGEAEAARSEAARRLLRASREDEVVESRNLTVSEPHMRRSRAASAFALSTVPLVALVVYGIYGSPNLPSQNAADRDAARAGGQDLMKAIGQIEAKLGSDPNDLRGWSVIAPVYMRLGRFDAAARAYENVVRLAGADPERLASWGEALVAASEGNVSPAARSLFERALAIDPKAAKPDFYLARSDEQAGDRAGAIQRLKALAARSPEDAPWMGLVREALTRLGNETAPAREAGAADAANGRSAAAQAPDTATAGVTAGPSANIQALPPAERMAAIRGMVEGLDRRLASQGGSVEDWMRLVRSYAALGERDKAGAVLARARAGFASGSPERAQLKREASELGLDAQESAEDGARGELVPPAGGADAAAAIRAMPEPERDAMIRSMVERLAQRLSAKGGSADEWMRLIRSYRALDDRPHALDAYERARMALAADSGAVARLDALGGELNLRRADAKP